MRRLINGEGISYRGKDSEDWVEYYVNRWVPAALHMTYNEVTWSRFVDHDMVMRFYLGHAVGHMYTHGSNLLLPVGTTWVMPEYEDMLVASDCGDGEESSSGSEEDSDMMSTELDAMDVDEGESEESDDMDADN